MELTLRISLLVLPDKHFQYSEDFLSLTLRKKTNFQFYEYEK